MNISVKIEMKETGIEFVSINRNITLKHEIYKNEIV